MIYKSLYKIINKSQDNNLVTILLSDKSHPVFKAHFPLKPVLPGFIHFEIVSDVFSIEIESIKKAKFVKMVVPKQTLVYKRDKNKFKVFCKDEEVASFSL